MRSNIISRMYLLLAVAAFGCAGAQGYAAEFSGADHCDGANCGRRLSVCRRCVRCLA